MVPYADSKLMDIDEELKLEKLKGIKQFKRDKEGYFGTRLIWGNVFVFVVIHALIFYTLLAFPYRDKIPTILFCEYYLDDHLIFIDWNLMF